MKCPICHTENRDDAKFCTGCGNQIPRCPTCGALIRSRVRYCPQDGTPIPAELLALLPHDSASASAPVRPAQSTSSQNQKRKPIGLIVGAVVAALLVLPLAGVGIYSLFDQEYDAVYAQRNQAQKITPSAVDTEKPEKDDSAKEAAAVEAAAKAAAQAAASAAAQAAATESATQAATEAATAAAQAANAAAQAAAQAATTAPTQFIVAPPVTVSSAQMSNLEYWIHYCGSTYLSEELLWGMNADACRLARNAIYAHSGRMFNDSTLQRFFNQFSWYQPRVSPEAFHDGLLNDAQIKNADVIVAYEERCGYR